MVQKQHSFYMPIYVCTYYGSLDRFVEITIFFPSEKLRIFLRIIQTETPEVRLTIHIKKVSMQKVISFN